MAQSAHLFRRVLEIGRAVANGVTTAELSDPVEPGSAVSKKSSLRGGYVTAQIEGEPVDVYYEERGQGRDVLLLHTAGADGRQYHDLMSNDALTADHRLVAFDLPGHGRSDPFPNRVIGGYSLTTELYASTVLAVVDALGLSSPIVSGSSMGGEICLELAYRASDILGGVIACEASEKVNGRKVAWAKHPLVNESLFVPEWVYGLMAPQSPEQYRRKVWWGYSQGGFSTFAGDIDFYSGDWDGTERVPLIDTAACPVVMMTGEYDYSCTPAMSEATAARIPGATFWPMPQLGHFPMAENPELFARHFERALKEIEHR
ncbi:alpha/beta hydrolase [Subtercola sp. Z020]|nr:alpha/beta hydrolase [Subtercola sp. Z020]